MKKSSNLSFFILSVGLILLDQGTKLYFKGFSFFGITHEGLRYGEQVPVLGKFLQFTYILNPGMAFGMNFLPKFALSLFSIVASIAIAWYLFKIIEAKFFVKLSIALIFAGATGNLIDRVFYGVIFNEYPLVEMMNPIDTFIYTKVLQGVPLFYGKVVDFIQVDIPDINFMGLRYTHWPVFNIADSCVSVGIVMLIIFNKHLPGFETLIGKKKSEADETETLTIESSTLESDNTNETK